MHNLATVFWRGGAPTVAQVNTWTFATAGTIGDIITVTIGSKIWTYTTTSATISVFLPLFNTAINALSSTVYPEFGEITFTNPTSSTIVATADTAGKPFTVTMATNSAGTTINGGASSTGTATTVSSGPEDISTGANYSTGAVPGAGDTLYVDKEGSRLKYGLSSQSATLLAVRRITARDVQIGLPEINSDGTEYPEYRATYWQQTATSDYVSTKGGRIKLNHGTGQTTYLQDDSGSGVESGIPAVLLCGTHASNAWTITGGNAGFAFFAADTARVNVGRLDAGAAVTCGIGCVNDSWSNYGGNLVVNSAIATALNHPGTTNAKSTVNGSGAVASLQMQGGTCFYNSTGTLGGNTVLANGATLTFDEDQRGKTITNAISLYSASAKVVDSFGVVTSGFTLRFINFAGSPKLKSNSQAVITYL